MNNNLLIIGAGGHGRVVKEAAESMELFDEIDYLDDYNKDAIGVLGDYELFFGSYDYAVVALGDSKLRLKWIKNLKSIGFKIPKIIHSTAYISPTAKIEEGVYIGAGAIVNTNVKIGYGSIIGIGAKIDHDSIVGMCSYVNAGAIICARSSVSNHVKVGYGQIS